MALTASKVRSFGFGHVYYAPVGTAEPANISAAVDTDDWTELGHVSDAGPRFSFGKANTPIRSWQSFPNPVRVLKGESINAISYDLMQWQRETLALALGGTWSGTSPNFVFTPSDSGVDPVALIVELVDGTAKWRFIVRKTENQAPTDFAAVGSGASPFPFQSVFLTPDDDENGPVKPYIIQTNDAPAAA